MSSEQQQPKEHTIYDSDFDFIWNNINSPLIVRDRINVIKSRSCPHPAPQQPTKCNVSQCKISYHCAEVHGTYKPPCAQQHLSTAAVLDVKIAEYESLVATMEKFGDDVIPGWIRVGLRNMKELKKNCSSVADG